MCNVDPGVCVMHCMMTEFLGDWPKPKTLDCCSLGLDWGGWRHQSWAWSEVLQLGKHPWKGREGLVVPHLPHFGHLGWVHSHVLVLPGGEDTWEGVRGSLQDPRLAVLLQLSSSVPQNTTQG